MCGSIVKCVFMLLNVVFLLVSLGFLVVGVLLAFVPKTLLQFIYDSVKIAADASKAFAIPNTVDEMKDLPMIYEIGLAFIALGCVLFVISFLGFCGAYCVCCKFMLLLFAIIVIGLMIGEIVIGTMYFVKDSPLHDTIRSELKKQITNKYEEFGTDPFSQSMNLVNHYFECCGVDSELDFGNKSHRSCPNNVTIGCYSKLTNIIQDNIIWAGLVLAALLLMQVIEVSMSIVIFKKNKISPF